MSVSCSTVISCLLVWSVVVSALPRRLPLWVSLPLWSVAGVFLLAYALGFRIEVTHP